MTGVNYITDEKGRRIAVQIDLRKHRKLWEDYYDAMIVEQRKKEPRLAWEDVKKKIHKKK